ncbi:choline dehydrogenase [Cribrihabitans marinus]|uniref:Choline dehydrogenase n=1 Tax=Cribrihabitans marinus TaxID=1227549 RepID=A0A1H7D9T8_9RHOB|nr:GMC family oxidoreductase N-terminal domain-containing protein [Cribrihabitans marinus]GGH38313.1 choline dehydrogenase [Cribrihabitans marinus]SEJ98623.1 choline dehydrogenase [Cribrihabitans marinus]
MAQPEYDYIVIGAGSAGCAVAGRLAEAGQSVLLLEAGGKDRNPFIHIPLGYSMLYANPKVNWCYESAPEPHLNNRRLFQPRGKVLGGTGAINGMIYMRGQPEDFDGWEAAGCTGWGWDGVLPCFKSCEDQERGADEYHGTGGPVAVSDIRTEHVLGEAFHAASEALGVPRNDDFNGAQQEGTGYVQTTTRNGMRWSTAAGYLRGAAKSRIDLKLGAMVERITLEGRRATGVRWTERRGAHRASARREIVLCGGTFNSPQLLQVSGIGPGALLRAHGIDVLHDLPGVGENLQDHFGIGAEYRSTVHSTVNDLYNNKLKGGVQLLRHLVLRTGPFADNGNYSNTFIRSGPGVDRPDMMVTFMAWCTDEQLRPRPFSGFTILAEHMRPNSRGHVRITGPDPTMQPEIQFNFFADESDQRAAIAGLQFGRKIAATPPMSDCVDYELAPGKDVRSESELLDYCRANGLSLLHPVGTCKMGIGKDAVVDPRLRVHGIVGLRVADASIMPRIVTGNTNAAAIMIGEKAAVLILEDAWETA